MHLQDTAGADLSATGATQLLGQEHVVAMSSPLFTQAIMHCKLVHAYFTPVLLVDMTREMSSMQVKQC